MSSSDHKAAAGAVGGKAARACDSCMRRRARWYCAADDAFLCQACDTSVHSANPLARRHERLRLRPSSSVLPPPPQSVKKGMAATAMSNRQVVAPGWTKRKARTRRPQVKSVGQLLSRRLVPEMAVESSSSEEPKEAEELLYHVPIFNPAFGDYHSPPSVDDTAAADSCRREDADGAVEITKEPVQQLPDNSFASFGPTDMEALLGQGLEDSFYMETLGLLSPSSEGSGRVKVEADRAVSKSWGAPASGPELKPELSDEVLDVDFNCSSSSGDAVDAQFLKRSLDLRLNYDTIIDNWGSSPWTDGRRPHVQLDDFLVHHHTGMWMAGGGRQGVVAGTPRPMIDGAREARVSRYREKRRTRLFAKKIRYEVRKLNAEKRPRMKGRFVKRPAGGATCAVTY